MKRRKWTPEEKMNIVLTGLKGDVSVAELCRRYNISQTLYYRWRDTFLVRICRRS
jgi:transposase-like protein